MKLDFVRGRKASKVSGGTTLTYYEGEDSVKAKGTVPIRECLSVDIVRNDGPTEFSLNIATIGRTWRLCAESADEQEAWRRALGVVMNSESLKAVVDVVRDQGDVEGEVDGDLIQGLDMGEKIVGVRSRAAAIAASFTSNPLLDSDSGGRGPPLFQPTGVGGNEVMKVDTLVKEAESAMPGYKKILDDVMKDLGLDPWESIVVDGESIVGTNRAFAEPGNPNPLGLVVGSGGLPFTRLTCIPSKSVEWCVSRADVENGGEIRKVVDVLRSFIVVDDAVQAAMAIKSIKAHARVVRLVNTHHDPDFTGIPTLTVYIAVPLPSSSVLKSTSKKKFHMATVDVYVKDYLKLKVEADEPYHYFCEKSYQGNFVEIVTRFLAEKEADEGNEDYISRVLDGQDYDLLETLDDIVSPRMMSDWSVKLKTSRKLTELSDDLDLPDHVVLGWAHEVGSAYEQLLEKAKAIAIYEKVMQARDRIFGDKDRDIMVTVNRIAGVYRSRGEFDQALDMYTDAVEKLQNVMRSERVEHEEEMESKQAANERVVDALRAEHVKELELRAKAHDVALEKLTEELREEQKAALEAADVAWLEKHEEALRQFKTNHDFFMMQAEEEANERQSEVVRELREIGIDLMKKEVEKHQLEMSQKDEEHEREKEILEKALAAKREESLREQKQKLLDESQKAREEIESEHKDAMAALEEDLRQTHSDLVKELTESHQTALQDMAGKDEHALETVRKVLKEELTSVHENKVKELKVGYEATINDLNRDHDRELEDERKQFVIKLEEKDQNVAVELEHIKGELDKARAEMESMKLRHVESLRETKSSYEVHANVLQEKLDAETEKSEDLSCKIVELEGKFEEAQKSIAAQLQSQADVKDLHVKTLSELSQNHESALKKLREEKQELTKNSGLKMEKTFAAHAAELKSLQNENDNFKKSSRVEFEELERNFESQLENKINDLKREHAGVISRLVDSRRESSAGHNATEELLKKKLEAAEAHMFDFARFVLYSSDTPDKADFSSMIRCQKAEYDFKAADLGTLVALIEKAEERARKELDDFGGFKSIALACHGPPKDADGDDDDGFEWKISEQIVITDDSEITNIGLKHPARQLMLALGKAVQDGSGRVDLFACSLLASREGKEVFDAIESETKANFAASTNLTGNPKGNGDWVMESDNIDVRDFYFWKNDDFDGTFEAHLEPPKMQEARIKYEKEIALLRKDMQRSLKEKEKEMNREIDGLRAGHKRVVASLEEEQVKMKKEMDKKIADHKQMIAEEQQVTAKVKSGIEKMKTDHENELNELKRVHVDEIDKRERDWARRIGETVRARRESTDMHEKTLLEVRTARTDSMSRHEAQVADLKGMLNEREKELSEEIRRLKEEQTKAVEASGKDSKKEKDALVQEHEKTIENIQEKHAEELEKLKAQEENRFQDFSSARRASTEMHERNLREVRSARTDSTARHDKEITEMRSMMKTREDELTAEIEKMKEEHSNNLTDVNKKGLEEKEKEMSRLRAERDAALDVLNAQHAEELEKLKAQEENRFQDFSSARRASTEMHEKNLREVRSARTDSTVRHDKEIAEMKSSIKAREDELLEEKERLKDKYSRSLDKANTEFATVVDTMEKRHKEELTKMKEEQKALTVEQQAALKMSHESTLSEMLSRHDEDKQKIKDEHSSALSILQENFNADQEKTEKKIGKIQEQHAVELRKLEAAHANEIEDMQIARRASTEGHEQSLMEIQRARAASAARTTSQIDDIQKRAAKELADMKTEHDLAIERLELKHYGIISAAEKARSESRAGHEGELEAEKARSEAEVQELQRVHAENWKKLEDDYAKEMTRVRSANAEVIDKMSAEQAKIVKARSMSTANHEMMLAAAQQRSVEELKAMKARRDSLVVVAEKMRQELETERKKIHVHEGVFKEERERNEREVRELIAKHKAENLENERDRKMSRESWSRRVAEQKKEIVQLESRHAAVVRSRRDSTMGHKEAIEFRDRELDDLRKHIEVETAERDAAHATALVELADEERSKRADMLARQQRRHEETVLLLEAEMQTLKDERDALQREIDKCVIS